MAAVRVLEVLGVGAGVVAVGALVYGSILLLRETRIAVQVISDRVASVTARAGHITDGTIAENHQPV